MKLIVHMRSVDKGEDRNCVIEVDGVEKDESFVYAYRENKLIGMFDIGYIMALYLSEANKQKEPVSNRQGELWEK